MEVFAVYVLKGLLLPPAGNLLLLALAWGLRRRRGLALALALVAGSTLLLAASPWFAATLARGLERAPPFARGAGQPVEAIVVPGTGRYTAAPEYGGMDTVSARTLERLRYAAHVHRATGWPIATVGGAPLDLETPEGLLMHQVLEQDFGVPVRWVERESRNTAENARNARRLLGVSRILLVTQAMDMPRARRMFEQAGFEVVPGPVGFVNRPGPAERSIFDFIPEAGALALSRIALHEYLGLAWYRLRY